MSKFKLTYNGKNILDFKQTKYVFEGVNRLDLLNELCEVKNIINTIEIDLINRLFNSSFRGLAEYENIVHKEL